MDIGSQNGWPSCALSNFAAHEFVIDGVQCASMEGFLQSLKFSNPDMQKEVCKLIGIKAKRAGKGEKLAKTPAALLAGRSNGKAQRQVPETA